MDPYIFSRHRSHRYLIDPPAVPVNGFGNHSVIHVHLPELKRDIRLSVVLTILDLDLKHHRLVLHIYHHYCQQPPVKIGPAPYIIRTATHLWCVFQAKKCRHQLAGLQGRLPARTPGQR